MRVDGTDPRALARRRDLRRTALWLAGCALYVALLLGPGTGDLATRALRHLNRRWMQDLGRAEAALEAGRLEEAAERYARAEARSTASWVRNDDFPVRAAGLERRARVLVALGRSAEAVRVLEGLVELDPRDWTRHVLLAQARRAVGDGAGEERALEAVLALHPSHLGSVEVLVERAAARGEAARVVSLVQDYLDALLLVRVKLELGGRRLVLETVADGRLHEAELPIGGDAGGHLALDPDGHPVRVGALELRAPLRAGQLGGGERTRLDDPDAWSSETMEPRDGASGRLWAPGSPGERLRIALPEADVAQVALTLAVHKSASPALVERALAAVREVAPERVASWEERLVAGGWREAGTGYGPTPSLGETR